MAWFIAHCEKCINTVLELLHKYEDSRNVPLCVYMRGCNNDASTTWCPDCEDAHPAIGRAVWNFINKRRGLVVEVRVSQENRHAPDYVFAKMTQFDLKNKGVPALYLWNSTHAFEKGLPADSVIEPSSELDESILV